MNQATNYEQEFEFLRALYEKISLNLSNLEINTFVNKMEPFVQLVNNWSCILGLMINNCKNYKVRKYLVENLRDENCQDLTHVETYCLFLNECVSDVDILDKTQILQKTDQVLEKTNKNLINFVYAELVAEIESSTFDESCQILGAIEYVYHLISRDINKYFELKRGKLPKYHYTAHEILDTKHATDLFKCSNSPANYEKLKFGTEWIVNSMQFLLG